MSEKPSLGDELAFDPASLWEGEVGETWIKGRSVLVMRVDGEVVAFENKCPHLGLPLVKGELCDGIFTCPFHGWSFDVRTGLGLNPKTSCLKLVDLSHESEPCQGVNG